MGCECGTCQVQMDLRGFTLLNECAVLPVRATKNSAGYDFYVPKDIRYEILPGETKLIDTQVAAYMNPNEYLDFRVRSSLAKSGLIFMNSCGVIDSDYYPNPIGAIVHNLSKETIVLEPGSKIAQGIFSTYLTILSEEEVTTERDGGFGSTGE